MNDATRWLWLYFSALPLVCPDKFPMVTLAGAVAFLEIARHRQKLHPVSIKQKIAESKRLRIVIRRYFRKRIIPKN